MVQCTSQLRGTYSFYSSHLVLKDRGVEGTKVWFCLNKGSVEDNIQGVKDERNNLGFLTKYR